MTLLPEVEHALLTAIRAPHAARSRSRSRQRLRALGPAVTITLSGLALLVAIGALVLLGGRHHPTATAPDRVVPAAVPSTRHTLLQTLGVLRRPQVGRPIKLDKLLRAVVNTPPPPAKAGRRDERGTSDRALLRSVAVRGTPYTAILAPIRYPATRGAAASMKLNLVLARPAIRRTNDRPLNAVAFTSPLSVATLRAQGLFLLVDNAANPGVMVVPDGVARIQIGPDMRLALTRSQGQANPNLTLPGQIAPVTATVHDNVAGFRLGRVSGHAKVSHGLFLVPVRLPATWYAANGRVIARFDLTVTYIRAMLRPPRSSG